jgi:hypothetical protein
MAKTKTKPKVQSKSDTPTASASDPFKTSDANEALRHFLPLVQAEVPADRAEVCRVGVEIVRTNVERGVEAIVPHLDRIRKKLPLCPIHQVLELPALALGFIAAAGRVIPPASEREIEVRMEKFRPMRELTLKQLEIHGELKLVPRQRVAAIRSGKGPLDSARDGVDIAGIFHEFEGMLAQKHPFSPEYLAEMAAHANWLLVQLKPKGAQGKPSERSPEALVRDQFWTVITRRYDDLREAGVAAFGLRQLDDHVPPLGARIQMAAPQRLPAPNGGTGTPLPS